MYSPSPPAAPRRRRRQKAFALCGRCRNQGLAHRHRHLPAPTTINSRPPPLRHANSHGPKIVKFHRKRFKKHHEISRTCCLQCETSTDPVLFVKHSCQHPLRTQASSSALSSRPHVRPSASICSAREQLPTASRLAFSAASCQL